MTGLGPYGSSVGVGDGEVRVVSSSGGVKGRKLARFDMMPPAAILELAKVYGYGEEKYPSDVSGPNFRKGYLFSLSFSAMQRHLWAWQGGEDVDPESGRQHLAHAAWHCFCLLSNMVEHPEFDDRFKA